MVDPGSVYFPRHVLPSRAIDFIAAHRREGDVARAKADEHGAVIVKKILPLNRPPNIKSPALSEEPADAISWSNSLRRKLTAVICRFAVVANRGRRILLFEIALAVVGLRSSAYAQTAIAAQASSDCGPVSDTIVASPDGTRTAHLMNQYCSYGFGAVYNPFWVVLGDEVARAGREDRVDQFGPEDHVVFKTDTFAPSVLWADEKSLVITVEEVSVIYKSLRSVDDVRIKYKIAEKLSREKYLGHLRDREPPRLFNRHLEQYEIFQKWATENAE
jgi:hypothetical protein